MGLSDLAKRLSGERDEGAARESRRIAALAGELLAAAPKWRNAHDQAALSADLAELECALKNLDGRLTLGLLGGTGVGKSTLISALAGEPISAASVIRPTTTVPLIYRHADFPPLSGLDAREVIHEVEALRALAIIDFPDFDSLESAHHEIVESQLRGLDVVLWVTDYHKYADRRLYELMRRATLGEMSQAALLNKRDELLGRADGEEALGCVSASFAEHLRDFGHWQGPPPWAISAAEALENPRDLTAGGLAPLRRLLDDLADAKYRRAVEMGNLFCRNRDFLLAVNMAAQPQEWLEQLENLGRLKSDYRPAVPLGADMDMLRLHRALYLNPRLEALKGKAQGLLALFTDLWDFAARRFRPAPENAAHPEALAPAFAHHLAGWSQEARAITGVGEAISEEEALKSGGEVLERAIAEQVKEPKISSAALWIWPLVWAFLLVWAESGGIFTPSALTAAALRAAAPWLIFAALGDLALSRFIWFRASRRYERAFEKALGAASQELLAIAETKVKQTFDAEEQNLTRILDLTADLNSGTKTI